jgi:hypothetical protein
MAQSANISSRIFRATRAQMVQALRSVQWASANNSSLATIFANPIYRAPAEMRSMPLSTWPSPPAPSPSPARTIGRGASTRPTSATQPAAWSVINRSSHALGVAMRRPAAFCPLSNDAGELGTRVDRQFAVDTPQVTVHRVGRKEEPVRDLTVRDSLRDEGVAIACVELKGPDRLLRSVPGRIRTCDPLLRRQPL